MIDPPTLWDPPPAPSKRGARSASADQGEAVAPACASRRYQILDFLFGRVESYTADELGKALGLSHVNARPRCSELVKIGWLEDAGLRRETVWGGTAGTLRITGRGVRVLELARQDPNPIRYLERAYQDAKAARRKAA